MTMSKFSVIIQKIKFIDDMHCDHSEYLNTYIIIDILTVHESFEIVNVRGKINIISL